MGVKFSLSNSTVVQFMLYFPNIFTLESAHPAGRDNWWFDVRASALAFVTTGARYYKRANVRKQQLQAQHANR